MVQNVHMTLTLLFWCILQFTYSLYMFAEMHVVPLYERRIIFKHRFLSVKLQQRCLEGKQRRREGCCAKIIASFNWIPRVLKCSKGDWNQITHSLCFLLLFFFFFVCVRNEFRAIIIVFESHWLFGPSTVVLFPQSLSILSVVPTSLCCPCPDWSQSNKSHCLFLLSSLCFFWFFPAYVCFPLSFSLPRSCSVQA